MTTFAARLFETFGTAARRPAEPARFRPTLCGLEAREVPAALTSCRRSLIP